MGFLYVILLETPGAALPRPTRSWLAHGELAESNGVAPSRLLRKLQSQKKQDYKQQQSDQTNKRCRLCSYFRDDRIGLHQGNIFQYTYSMIVLNIVVSVTFLINQRIQNYGILLDGFKL